jgi:tetratricopeptide (TPR) repeat protein
LVIASGCVPSDQKQFEAAQAEIELGHFRIAIDLFDKILTRFPGEEISLKAAREAARVSFFEIKDFKKSTKYQKFIVMYSENPEERYQAQKQIADTYFTQLNDYPNAVIEINKLLAMARQPVDRAKYKMNLARAYYYQNNFSQAENEVNEFLRQIDDEKTRYELMMLKGNIALAKKDLLGAVDIYKDVMKSYPQKAEQESVALTVAVCYEELKDYKKAIEMLEVLKKTHPMPEYIDVRIKRLLARQKNAPGAKGMRK